MTKEKKKKQVEDLQEVSEEVSKETEKTVEKSELELAIERADEFEDKYLRTVAEMQNIQRRSNEERQTLQKYRSQDLAKAKSHKKSSFLLGEHTAF